MKKNIFVLAGFVLLCASAGIVGGLFTAPAIKAGWYATLVRPDFAPPNWVFGPVWTALYALMGVAAYLIWRKGNDRCEVKTALKIFHLQLLLNLLWSIIFFGLAAPGAAFAEIILLWLAIVATIAAFTKISPPAAWLLAPYLLWVTFAGYLNYAIWILNRS